MATPRGGSSRSGHGLSRRGLLRAGFLGLAGLGLPDLLRAGAKAGVGAPGDGLSVILVWLDGGPPQHETYDPKPDAPSEFRGPLKAIPTRLAGVSVSELMPETARLLDKVALIRSMGHGTGDHFTAAHYMLTGQGGPSGADTAPKGPSVGSIVARLKGPARPGVPPYVGLPNTHSVGLAPGYHGASYLGSAYNPFTADGDPNAPGYGVPNLSPPPGVDAARLEDRRGLLSAFDAARRGMDGAGPRAGLDAFNRQAFDMISGPEARAAFDIGRESPRLRDRYGRNTWGQSALVARRLVEAGVRFVTLTFGGWDMHSSLETAARAAVPKVDSAVSALVDDLSMRGRLDSTLVLVMGEFGRTPRINKTGVPGVDPVPGRDHWGGLMSVLVAGGGVRGGQVIGASNSRGEVPRERPVSPQDLIVTVYRKLGIDPETAFEDRSGRPITIGSTGQVIAELM